MSPIKEEKEGGHMLYITRNRIKENVGPKDLGAINRFIDEELVPAVTKVEGVRSAAAYNSITGEVTFILDIQDLATIDRVLADKGLATIFGKLMKDLVRTGGEVLYDRPTWQGLYGKN
jgi:hypothetical protein